MATFLKRKQFSPIHQGAFVLLTGLLIMLGVSGSFDNAEWYIMAGSMFFYSAASTMLGAFWTKSFGKYVLLALIVFLVMGTFFWISASAMSDAQTPKREIRLLFVAIAVFYFVMNGLSVVYRAVVRFAKKM